jgi:small GTP-binding protein
VGKTSIINRYVNNTYNEMSKSTIGVDCQNKLLPRQDLNDSMTSSDINHKNENIQMQIWDTTGQENFRSINRIYYRGSHGAALVFDLCNKSTLDSLDSWVCEF